MTDRDESFLVRWARRKDKAREAPAEPGEPAGPPPTRRDGPAEPSARADPDEVVARLPDIEGLTESSDFTAFLQDAVPEAIRRRALRKLWRLNPVFANLDGLNDYDEDFTDAATVVEHLKTAYRVGRGMVSEAEESARESADDATAGPEEGGSEADDGTTEPEGAGTAEAATGPEGSVDAVATRSAQAPIAATLEADGAPIRHDAPAPTRRSGRSAAERRWGAFKG